MYIHIYADRDLTSYVGLSFEGNEDTSETCLSLFSSLSPRLTALCSLPLSSGWIVRTGEIGSERDDEPVDSRREGGSRERDDGYA